MLRMVKINAKIIFLVPIIILICLLITLAEANLNVINTIKEMTLKKVQSSEYSFSNQELGVFTKLRYCKKLNKNNGYIEIDKLDSEHTLVLGIF